MRETRNESEGPDRRRLLRALVALVPPVLALIIQLSAWTLTTHVWFLFFYPAVFLSSWIGGPRAGLVATALSAGAVLWFIVPPTHSLIKPIGFYFPLCVFVAMGVLFAIFHDRLRRATRRTAEALAGSEMANQRLQSALKERRLFAALIENSSDFIGIADPDGKPIYVNPAGRRMVGLAPGTRPEDTQLLDYYPPDERAFASNVIVKSMLEHGHWQGETYFRNWQTEQSIPVSDTHFTIRDPETGEVLGMGTVTRDIGERLRLETALHASHDDLVRAQSVAHVGSWRLDLRHGDLQWSDELFRIFGVASDTPTTYEAFLAIVHPDDRAYVEKQWSAALRGEPYDIEHRIVVNGDVRWVREVADLEFDSAHTLVGGLGVTLDITDRKRREEELRQTHERLQLALHGADLASWDWNVVTGDVISDPRWAAMRGYRPGELPARVESWLSAVHPDDLPQVQRVLDEHFRGLRPDYESEHRIRTKSGEWIWILDRGKVVTRDERGEPLRMVGTELDVTARKRAEEALRRAEAKASGILAISADALLSIDEEQRITMFNSGAETTFGYTKDEVLGAPLDILIPERLRAVHRQHVARFAAGEQVARHMGERGDPIFGLRKNGEEFPADAAISKLEVDGERILTVALRDITEERRVAEEQRFLAKLGELVAASLDPGETLTRVAAATVGFMADLVIVDLVEGSGLRRAKVAHAAPADAEVARAIESLPPQQHQPRPVRVAIRSRQTQIVFLDAEFFRAEFPDPSVRANLEALRSTSVMLVPLIARDSVIGVMSFVCSKPGKLYGPADVRLGEEVARRAALALENARLYELAQDAIEARDDILGVVAHDLRNPLNSIVLQASLLRELEPKVGRGADVIERAAMRMNRLIQDLLDVTRMEAGHLALARERATTAQVVWDAVEGQKPMAASAAIDLRVELTPDLPEVWADRDRLLQTFENLIGNALKFTKAGGCITIGAAPRDGEVMFWVADTGTGIAPGDIEHLFDRFWQAHKAEKRGAGLGLPIVKGIVEAHGGHIWVESTPGQGSTFFFTIPCVARTEDWRGEHAPPAH